MTLDETELFCNGNTRANRHTCRDKIAAARNIHNETGCVEVPQITTRLRAGPCEEEEEEEVLNATLLLLGTTRLTKTPRQYQTLSLLGLLDRPLTNQPQNQPKAQTPTQQKKGIKARSVSPLWRS